MVQIFLGLTIFVLAELVHRFILVVDPQQKFHHKVFCTQQKMNNLFWPDESSIEQCFAAHIVQGCQQYCSTLLLHLIAG